MSKDTLNATLNLDLVAILHKGSLNFQAKIHKFTSFLPLIVQLKIKLAFATLSVSAVHHFFHKFHTFELW